MTDLLSTLSGWLSYGSFFLVFAATFVPILIAYYLTRGGSETAGMGK